jgi:hypothetical protein
LSLVCEFSEKCSFSKFRHTVVKWWKWTRNQSLPVHKVASLTFRASHCQLRPMALFSLSASTNSSLLTVSSDQWRAVSPWIMRTVTLGYNLCVPPMLLQRHHVDCSRGLTAHFEGGHRSSRLQKQAIRAVPMLKIWDCWYRRYSWLGKRTVYLASFSRPTYPSTITSESTNSECSQGRPAVKVISWWRRSERRASRHPSIRYCPVFSL